VTPRIRIFFAARDAGAIVMSKDKDFAQLVLHHGPPPQVIWITCGNTSNARLDDLHKLLVIRKTAGLAVQLPEEEARRAARCTDNQRKPTLFCFFRASSLAAT
jgi:hypothetical protein